MNLDLWTLLVHTVAPVVLFFYPTAPLSLWDIAIISVSLSVCPSVHTSDPFLFHVYIC